uniref:Mitochondrial import inner membrane translocase subunit TIM50 n=1 Tax=Leersia perrieri TaxID=77586 RepID=A0A0D9VZ59_9ORYZ
MASLRGGAAARKKRGSPATENNGEEHTDAQRRLRDISIAKSENNMGGAFSTQGDLPRESGYNLEEMDAQLCAESVHRASNQLVNSNENGNPEFQVVKSTSSAGNSEHWILDCNKATDHDMGFMPPQGSRFDVNARTNDLQSTTEGRLCQRTVGEGFTGLSGVGNNPYSVHENQRIGSTVGYSPYNVQENQRIGSTVGYNPYSVQENQRIGPFMREAYTLRSHYLHPPHVRGYMDNPFMIFPSVHPMNALDPFNQGFNFFQTGNVPPYGVSEHWEYEYQRNMDDTNVERNKLNLNGEAYLPTHYSINCIRPSSLSQAYEQMPPVTLSPRLSLRGFRKKKLLILDLNGLLADINQDHHNSHMAVAKFRGRLVFRRPYCHDFLTFCLQNFELGIWSSRKKQNVDSVIDIIMRDFKPFLLFCWDMSKCTFTGHKTLDNVHKPLMLKELRKLWNKEEPDLPWGKGEYSPSNTLLVDDSPYKALRNPPYTAIFPRTYSYLDCNDCSLGPDGDLRVYLENLSVAEDVECYVRNNPFGQPFITQNDPNWSFYAQIANQ